MKPSVVVNLEKLAIIAAIPLSEKELKEFTPQITSVIDYANEIQNIDFDDLTISAYQENKVNEFREDVIQPSLSQEEVLKLAPRSHNGYFVAPGLLYDES